MKDKNVVTYCKDCGRIEGIGCACHMTFREKMKGIALTLPASFRAVS